MLAAAWNDHRQQVPGTLEDASRDADRLPEAHPELIVVENYSSTPVACGRCRAYEAFRPAPLETIVQILGWRLHETSTLLVRRAVERRGSKVKAA